VPRLIRLDKPDEVLVIKHGFGLFCLGAGLVLAAVSCAPMSRPKTATSDPSDPLDADGESDATDVAVAMPLDAAAVRDDPSAAILMITSVGRTTFPSVYGYPIYPDGDAARGIPKLRSDNYAGAHPSEIENDSGVKLAREELPRLGCRFDGVRETAVKFVPISLTCELPAPKALGGANRPVVDQLSVAAKAEDLLKQPSVETAFLGEFHLTSDDAATGEHTGYFNTTHGQLAFVYVRKRLTRFVYYFDPGVHGWQNQELWVKP
jgi:hypothetical protein